MSPFRTKVPWEPKPVFNPDMAVDQRVRTRPPRKPMILDQTSPLITRGPIARHPLGTPARALWPPSESDTNPIIHHISARVSPPYIFHLLAVPRDRIAFIYRVPTSV